MKTKAQVCILAYVALLLLMCVPNAHSDASTNIVFVGDSITARCDWSELLPDYRTANQGIDGDIVLDVLERIDDVIALEPNKLFLMIGINDILIGYDMGIIQQDYEDLLDVIQGNLPNARVYVQSVLPVEWQDINETIVGFNSFIQQASVERGFEYIDLYDDFLDEHGQLKPAFSADGLHLTEEAYRLWAALINKYL
ncbi:MAG: GDSL-type esterase/lipase family protein [Clostridia bacterium]|nr:GDSL-type esterase/lipase family protein [Clostridia bacterium]